MLKGAPSSTIGPTWEDLGGADEIQKSVLDGDDASRAGLICAVKPMRGCFSWSDMDLLLLLLAFPWLALVEDLKLLRSKEGVPGFEDPSALCASVQWPSWQHRRQDDKEAWALHSQAQKLIDEDDLQFLLPPCLPCEVNVAVAALEDDELDFLVEDLPLDCRKTDAIDAYLTCFK